MWLVAVVGRCVVGCEQLLDVVGNNDIYCTFIRVVHNLSLIFHKIPFIS